MMEQERYNAQLIGNPEFCLCKAKVNLLMHYQYIINTLQHRYSHTGNLRAHLTGSYKAKLA